MPKKKNLSEKIVDAYEDVVRKEKIIIHLDRLREKISEENARLLILDETVRKEEGEYLGLEKSKTGIRRLFFQFLQADSDILDREKQEYFLASLKREECIDSLKQMEREEDVLSQILYDLFDAEKKLDRLLLEKRKGLAKESKTIRLRVGIIEEEIIRDNLRLREIEDAKAAGEKVRSILQLIVKELQEVEKGRTFEYGGKGRHSSYKKKKYIEIAKKEVFKANKLLYTFEQELHDVSIHYDLHYEKEVRFFEDFLKVFLENLIHASQTKKMVTGSLEAISSTLEQVKTILKKLLQEIEKTHFSIQNHQSAAKKILLDKET